MRLLRPKEWWLRRADAERLPAELPRATGAGAAIEQHEVLRGNESEPLKIEGDGEACLPRADDDNGGRAGVWGHSLTLPSPA